MTKEQALAMLKAKRECIELDTKGNAELCDRNCGECKLNYEQGNMGEQKIALEMAINALERDTPMKVNIEEWIYTQCPSGCGYELSTHHGDGYYSIDKKPTFCPKCGQRLDWGRDND